MDAQAMQCPTCGEARLVRVPMRPPECAIGTACPPLGRRSMRCAACDSAFCDVCLPWPTQEAAGGRELATKAPLASKGQAAPPATAKARRKTVKESAKKIAKKVAKKSAKTAEKAASKKAVVSKGPVAAAPAPAIMKSRRTTAKDSAQQAPAPQSRSALPFKKRPFKGSLQEASLKDCVSQGKWPDGAPVGAKSRYTPILLEQYADAIRNGSKTHEGRPFCGFVAPAYMEGELAIHPNDYIIFKVKETRSMLPVRVLGVKCYPAPQGFREMVADVGIAALLPGFDGDLEAAVNVYRGFKNQKGSYAELESKHGAVAIAVQFFRP